MKRTKRSSLAHELHRGTNPVRRRRPKKKYRRQKRCYKILQLSICRWQRPKRAELTQNSHPKHPSGLYERQNPTGLHLQTHPMTPPTSKFEYCRKNSPQSAKSPSSTLPPARSTVFGSKFDRCQPLQACLHAHLLKGIPGQGNLQASALPDTSPQEGQGVQKRDSEN